MSIETGEKPRGNGEPAAEINSADEGGAAISTPEGQVLTPAQSRWQWLHSFDRTRQYVFLGLQILISLVVLVFTATYWWPAQQSYVVDTQTRGVSLTFDGGGISAWKLGSATVCIRARGSEVPPADLPIVSTAQCPEELYWPVDLSDAEFLWEEGTRMDLRATAQGGVAIELISTAPDQVVLSRGTQIALTAFSRILIPPQSWAGHPVLPFSSTDIGIGNVPGAGEEGIVVSGRYEVRQTLPFRPAPITVDQGIFFAGDSISFDAGRARNLPPIAAETGYQVYGFVAPLSKPKGIVSVVAYSALSRAALRIDRLGVETRHIEADWTHRAIRDPVLLAIAALISFLVVLSPLGFVWKSTRRARFRR